MTIEDKLKELRGRWQREPMNRASIEFQAKILKSAHTRYVANLKEIDDQVEMWKTISEAPTDSDSGTQTST